MREAWIEDAPPVRRETAAPLEKARISLLRAATVATGAYDRT